MPPAKGVVAKFSLSRVVPFVAIGLFVASIVHCRQVQGVSIDREDGAADVAVDVATQPEATVDATPGPGKKPCRTNCIHLNEAGGTTICNELGATEEYDCRDGTACCLDTRSCVEVGGSCLDLLPSGGCTRFGPPSACPRDTSSSTCCIAPKDAGTSEDADAGSD